MQKISEFNLKGDTASFKRAKLKSAPGTVLLAKGAQGCTSPLDSRAPSCGGPQPARAEQRQTGASGGLGPEELRAEKTGFTALWTPSLRSHTGAQRKEQEDDGSATERPWLKPHRTAKGGGGGGRGNPGGLREKLLCPSCEKRSKIQGGEARRRRGPHEWLLLWKLSE